METISINNKEYKVQIAKTEEEKQKGLQGVKDLPKDEGMLFVYDEPQTVGYWMEDTYIPLDIIFIDDDYEVISVYTGKPLSKDIVEEDNVKMFRFQPFGFQLGKQFAKYFSTLTRTESIFD